jgi:prepilin-type N-terminal cleavage/methylation domain-containing protein
LDTLALAFGNRAIDSGHLPLIMKSKRAFTLVELLVVVAIIAILALLVSVAAVRSKRRLKSPSPWRI